MLGWLRSWKGGCTIAVACLAIGVVRIVDGAYDVMTWGSVALAACYGFAAVVERRASNVRRAVTRADGADPVLRTRPSRVVAWLSAERGFALDPGERPGPPVRIVSERTRDRVGAVLAIAAAVVGLALVLRDRDIRSPDIRGPDPSRAAAVIDGR